ncbi:uncharacterized protein LOC111887354 [Lactuca sativa]|uniref:uncharacterized protein LOC111887354 n=1 Tax=Lactuca sativa TaxID=4236 RepID=UPI0022AE8252|nr:uncharacterized protein LOC111887354 [Lactuca sativa]
MEYSKNILLGVKNKVENGVGLKMKHFLLHFLLNLWEKNGDGLSNALESRYDFFKQKSDARGRMGFSSIQKCAAALRYLRYGISFDTSDEYLKVSERTAVGCVDWFSACVYEVFHEQYLRKPTQRDIERLYLAHEERHGFPARSNNDLNVLGQSPLFNDIWTNKAPDMTFTVNGHAYKYGYYNGDGIYPDYSTLMKAYSVPRSEKTKLFTKKQESTRKDIERVDGEISIVSPLLRSNLTRAFDYNHLYVLQPFEINDILDNL